MHETSNLPPARLLAPNRHPSSYPQSPRAQRADAKFAVGKIRQNTTQSDRIPHDATKTRARAHARTRGRQRRSVSLLSAWTATRPQRIRRTA